MYLSARWSGSRLRSILRLALGGLVGLVVLIPDVLDVPEVDWTPYYIVGLVAGLALLASAISTVSLGHFAGRAWVEVLATFLLLATALSSALNPYWEWSDEIAVTGFIVFYLYELRGIIRSNPALYAALAIAGVIAIASVAMADAEMTAPNAQITSASAAVAWAISQVLRAGVLVDIEPVTPAGDVLGFIIILSGVLFTAVFISSITAWAVRQRDQRSAEPVSRQVLRALIEAGLVPDPKAPPDPASKRRIFVDIDHYVGSRPRNWWRSRLVASSDALSLLETADLSGLALDDGRTPHLIAVLEGPSGELADQAHRTARGFDVTDAGPSADEWILEHAATTDLVITDDAHFADRLDYAGIPHQSWSVLHRPPSK